ncbi:hypothetical protein JTB14_005155 [Gonioctena quinquepunctata]|nr:hypothetical protein JTB14_005155 [Gonioctena quinquepunctata]
MWDEEVAKWQREHYGIGMSKAELSISIGKVWNNISASALKKSFAKTGLYDDLAMNQNPMNRKAIKISNFKQADIDVYESIKQNNIDPPLKPNLDHATTSNTVLPLIRRGIKDDYLKQFEESTAAGGKYKNKKQTAKPPLKRKKKENEESDSTSFSDIVSEGDEGNYDGVSSLQELVKPEKGVSDTESSDAIDMESWVVVTYFTKKTLESFVGKVIEVSDDNIRVTFLKMEGEYFVWPHVQNIDTTNKDDVLQILPSPKEGLRGELYFSVKFDGLNVQ